MTLPPNSSSGLIERALPYLTRSRQQRQAGQFAAALANLDALLAEAPMFVPCLPDRATLLAELGRYAEALADLRRYFKWVEPTPELQQARDGIADLALAELDRAHRRAPEALEPLLGRGRILVLANRASQAEAAFADVLARDGAQVEALAERGWLLLALDRAEESLACYERLQALEPGNAIHAFNRGNVLKALLRLEAAKAAYAQAQALAPDLAEARLETGLCHLMAADYAAGWPLFEARWQTAQMSSRHLPTAAPRWRGEPLAPGATLLLWAEQGLGDCLQFLRFVPEAVARCGGAGKVVLRLPRTLLSLAEGLGAVPIDDHAPLPSHDSHCPLMSLPLVLGIAAPPPLTAPYLHSDPALRSQWRKQLAQVFGASRRPRVGLVWTGRQRGPTAASRDVPLSALAPLAGLQADLVCLQQDIPLADRDALAGFPGLWRPALDMLADTAALVDELDLVVSVDTALAHLTGALGRPCHVLLRHSSEWRWQLGRTDTPWYPSLRLIRQPRPGDWAGAVAELVRTWPFEAPIRA